MHRSFATGLSRAARGIALIQEASHFRERRLRAKFARLRTEFYDRFWSEAACRVGADLEPLESGFTRIRRGDAWTVVRRYDVMLDDHVRLELMGHKAVSQRLFVELGCPVPAHVQFDLSNLAPARALLQRCERVVVKPVHGSGGRGVTPGVTTSSALLTASLAANRFGRELLAEQHVNGESYRLLYLDGVLVDAVRRGAPSVIGDGRSTLGALVRAESHTRLRERPIRALSPLSRDLDYRLTLRRAGRRESDVPAAGETIEVKTASNENAAGQQHVVTARVHPSLVRLGARLTRSLGIVLAGLDVLTPDITVPLDEAHGVINEVNTTPGLHHHVLVADDPSARADVGALVLERLLAPRRAHAAFRDIA